MKIAIIGSRGLDVKLEGFLPEGISMVISGGAMGIDRLAERYADKNGIPKKICLPEYEKYGKKAPLIRDRLIVDDADIVYAFWDCKSRGTKYTIDYAKSVGKEVKLILFCGIKSL